MYDWDDDSPATKFLHILSDFGQENFNPTIVYSFVTLPTTEEAQVISMYKTDLVDTQLSPSQNRFRRNTLHRRICMACFLKSCRKTTYS